MRFVLMINEDHARYAVGDFADAVQSNKLAPMF